MLFCSNQYCAKANISLRLILSVLRNNHGFVALYVTAGWMVLLAMLYVMFVLKESVSRHAKDRPKDAIIVKLDKGCDIMVIFIKSSQVSFFLDCCKNFLQLSLSGLRTLFKKRPEGARRWILCFTAVFCMSKAIESGAGSVIYMFYR